MAARSVPTYWEVTLGSSGRPEFVFRDPVMTATSPGFVVNDGLSHRVVGRRIDGDLEVTVDGAATGVQTLSVVLGALPPLETAAPHPCGERAAAEGWVTEVCVRPL